MQSNLTTHFNTVIYTVILTQSSGTDRKKQGQIKPKVSELLHITGVKLSLFISFILLTRSPSVLIMFVVLTEADSLVLQT